MRFGRKAATEPEDGEDVVETAPGDAAARLDGPHDADELDLEDDPAFARHIDLGGLVVAPPPEGVELRLQVDEESQTVLAVVLTAEEGALELRPFAASRNGDLWADVRPQIAAETARHGGTADEQDGPFGTELRCLVPVQTTGGQSAAQPSRVIGINGPRWMLRATLVGRPAVEADAAGPWEDALRGLVVRRGTSAMPPGEPLELTLPPEADRQD
ncbi:MAG: DUF3710 domain-containing protein [Sporichthyaceae bacterium]